MTTRSPRVCYFGTYRARYSRNEIMIEGLRRNGFEVLECHRRLWHSFQDRQRVVVSGWWRPEFVARLVRVYAQLVWDFIRLPDFDVMMIGYPGQLDVVLARALCWLRGKPLVWDIFMSIYLITRERGIIRPKTAKERLIHGLEWVGCRLPDMLIIDTLDYAAWFQRVYGLPARKFRLVPTGADDRLFRPMDVDPEATSDKFRVVYHGTFIPNHGVMKIMGAALLLKDEPDIEFILIGDGPDRSEAMAFARANQLDNVRFVGWVDRSNLIPALSAADLILGAFGESPQSLMTIQNKIYEGIAIRKPILSGHSPAVTKVFTHDRDIYLCQRDDPNSLSDGIRFLKDHPKARSTIGKNGYDLFTAHYGVGQIGRTIGDHLRELLNSDQQHPA